jgi:DNA-binding transcriptional MerR regulator
MDASEGRGWVSTQEVADRLQCTPAAVRKLARTGRLGQQQVSERFYLYDAADVARLVAEKGERRRLPKRPKS